MQCLTRTLLTDSSNLPIGRRNQMSDTGAATVDYVTPGARKFRLRSSVNSPCRVVAAWPSPQVFDSAAVLRRLWNGVLNARVGRRAVGLAEACRVPVANCHNSRCVLLASWERNCCRLNYSEARDHRHLVDRPTAHTRRFVSWPSPCGLRRGHFVATLDAPSR